MSADGEIVFTAMIEPLVWGTSTYTIIRVPDALADAATTRSTRRVAGTLDETAVNLAITRAPVVPGPFLWAGKSLLRKMRVETGDLVEARLHPADADAVDVPEDVATALAAAAVRQVWDELTPANRRRKLYAVESKASDRARQAAIAALVASLRAE